MLQDSSVLSVRHEPAEFEPAGDIVVESRDGIESFQAKHAVSPHGLIELADLLEDPSGIKLTVNRLWRTWQRYEHSSKPLTIRIFSNRAAGPSLAKLLEGHGFASTFIAGAKQKRAFRSIRAALGNPRPELLRRFLGSIRFDLRQPGLEELRTLVRSEHLERRLGLTPSAATLFFERVRVWYEARRAVPITRDDVLSALPIDRSTLPQTFPIDRTTLIERVDVVESVVELIDRHADGYVAVLGPPGCGKSTLLTRVVEHLRKSDRPVLRYYGFTSLADTEILRRITRDEFVKSIIEQLYESYGDILPLERRYEYSPERLLRLLEVAGERFHRAGRALVLVVDGIDHVARARTIDATQKLLSVLPPVLPVGVRCVLGSQGISHAPRTIELLCGADRRFLVPAFSDAQASRYLRRHPAIRTRLSPKQLASAVSRGEGLPLYLRYIAERLSGANDDDIESVIAALPPYSGDIDAYYATLWSEAIDQPFIRLCGFLARLPFAVQPRELAQLTGLESFEASAAYERARHLLHVSMNGCRIFHNSFREFVASTLSDISVEAIDRAIFNFLCEARHQTREWYEHAFACARLGGQRRAAIDLLDDAFVDGAIGCGVSAARLTRTLNLGVQLAADDLDVVAVARLTSLLNNTRQQLFDHLDSPQLVRTLLELDEPEAALVRAFDAMGGRSISEAGEVLVALARIDRRDLGREAALSFLADLPSRLDMVPVMMQVARVVAAYQANPAPFLAQTLFSLRTHDALLEGGASSADILTPDLIDLLERVDAPAIDQVAAELEKEGPEAREVLSEWRAQAACSAARRSLNPAAGGSILLAAGGVAPERRLWLAAEAALCGCATDVVRELLGEATFLPPVDNAAALQGGQMLVSRVRAYAAALVGANRDSEFRVLLDYLGCSKSWLAVYWQAVVANSRTTVRLARRDAVDAEDFLGPVTALARHKHRDGERLFDVLPMIRGDAPRLLHAVIRGFLAANGSPSALLVALSDWAESELVTLQFGIGVAVRDYGAQFEALEIAARYPQLHTELQPLVQALRERVATNVVTTFERSSQLLRVAALGCRVGLKRNAREWRDEGVRAARGYGVRKDYTLDALVDAAKIVERFDHQGGRPRLADILNWCGWMDRATDGKGTKWFFHYAFDLAQLHSPAVAARLLRTYAETLGTWRYSDCLAEFLQGEQVVQPRLAYVWSECINECTWEEGEGTRDRFRARVAILQAAKARDPDATEWVRTRVQQSLCEEVPPDARARFNAYLTAIESGQAPEDLKPEAHAEIKEPPPKESPTFELDGRLATSAELSEAASISPDDFARVFDQARVAADRFALLEAMRESLRRLVAGARDASTLDHLVAVVESRIDFDHAECLRIAARYAALGARAQQHRMLRAAFSAVHSWHLYDKQIELLRPLVDDDAEETLRFLLQHVAAHSDRYGVAFGAATLLVRSLAMFPHRYHHLIAPTYDAFHASVGSLFSSLPHDADDPFAWLREPPTAEPIDEIAFALICEEWSAPALHRRIALTHLLTDYALAEPKPTLEQLVGLLRSDRDTLRVLSSMVLEAIAIRAPSLVDPFRAQIVEAQASDSHAAIRLHLTRTLRAIGVEASLVQPQARSPTITLPSGSPRGSRAFEAACEHVIMPLRERVNLAAEILELDEHEVEWRIEREMNSAGLVYETAIKEERNAWSRFSAPSERDIVPFESPLTSAYYHAASRVLGTIAERRGVDDKTFATVARALQLYDSAFPFQWPASKPQIVEEYAVAPDVADDRWLSFDGLPLLQEKQLSGSVPLFETWTQLEAGRIQTLFRVSCMVETALTPALLERSLAVKPGAYIEMLARPDERVVTVKDAQEALLRPVGRLGAGQPQSSVAFHVGAWWHGVRSVLGCVSRTLIEDYKLEFESPRALHLSSEGSRAVFCGPWVDGVRARKGYYHPVASGYRVSVERRFVDRLRDDGRAFIVEDVLTRQVHERWGTSAPRTNRVVRTTVVR